MGTDIAQSRDVLDLHPREVHLLGELAVASIDGHALLGVAYLVVLHTVNLGLAVAGGIVGVDVLKHLHAVDDTLLID